MLFKDCHTHGGTVIAISDGATMSLNDNVVSFDSPLSIAISDTHVWVTTQGVTKPANSSCTDVQSINASSTQNYIVFKRDLV